jgi:quercetin dioxygenase-like cupin family protein
LAGWCRATAVLVIDESLIAIPGPIPLIRRQPAMKQPSFTSFPPSHGLLANMCDEFPSSVYGWSGDVLEMPAGSTHFGYVQEGFATVACASGRFSLTPGMYFSVPGNGTVSGDGAGIVISRHGYNGFFQVGGPVEKTGRLNYIDGCTDSLLVAPILMGDPCLNLLCFPPGINQTPHTHPSIRVGVVASGRGNCITADQVIPLRPGRIFIIHAHQLHSFATQDSSMRVIAYHPDSDFGATHEDHPMINRTFVEGSSASLLSEIRTR